MLFIRLPSPRWPLWSALRQVLARRDMNTSPHSVILDKIQHHGPKIAIVDERKTFTYSDIDVLSSKVAKAINSNLSQQKVKGQARICYLTPHKAEYVATQLGIWKSGHIAIPLSQSHPVRMIEYFIRDSDSHIVIATENYVEKAYEACKDLNKKLLVLEDFLNDKEPSTLSDVDLSDNATDAMILYTSGTTGSPKGVVLTHVNLEFQVRAMQNAWRWSSEDSILHVLPLHHTHGIVNCLLTPLFVGARVVMLPEFDSSQVWSHLLFNDIQSFPKLLKLRADSSNLRKVNVFMGVPTIYKMLLESHKRLFNTDEERIAVRECLMQNIRLMVCGSAALPENTLEEFKRVSGHTLLERYGMTEVGMALTNPYEPVSERKPGFVGKPFPGVDCRIVDYGVAGKPKVTAESDSESYRVLEETPGELQIKGPNVFREYFHRHEETAREFTEDGWFKSGDTAVIDQKNGSFKILGRTSVDIIKSGGYKLSALDIEKSLLSHPDVQDVAVVGKDDDMWGQLVAAVVVLKPNRELKLEDIPRALRIMAQLPRNSMGKVNKKELLKEAFP